MKKNNKTRSTKVQNDVKKRAARPQRPLRKPPGKSPPSSSPAKPAENKPAQPSPPPKKSAGK